MKHRRSLWQTKAQRTIGEPICVGKKRRRCKRKKAERGTKDPIAGKIGKVALPSLDSDTELFCVDAAAGRLEPKGEAEVLEISIVSDAVEGKSLQEEQKGKYQREWKRSKLVDRNEMRKEEKLRCALKYMSRYKGTFESFF